MSVDISGKKVFFIGPVTYDYHKKIRAALESHGALVDFYGEREESFVFRFIQLFIPKMLSWYKKYNQKNMINLLKKEEFDYVYVIRGGTLNPELIKRIKDYQFNAKFIMYQWDAVKRYDYTALIPCFDKVFSFDRQDCQTYGLEYCPLFYDEKYQELGLKNSDEKYDLLFVGSMHGDRYEVLEKLAKDADEKQLTYYFYLYLPLFQYLKILMIDRNFSMKRFLKFKSLQQGELMDLIKVSKTIVDINHEFQCGLTIRTMETLGAGKKLITTNKWIKQEDFYDFNCIEVINRKSPDLRLSFFEKNYKPEISDQFILQKWIKNFFIETTGLEDV